MVDPRVKTSVRLDVEPKDGVAVHRGLTHSFSSENSSPALDRVEVDHEGEQPLTPKEGVVLPRLHCLPHICVHSDRPAHPTVHHLDIMF